MPLKMRMKLSAMMFLQFMMMPVWFIPMINYVKGMPDAGNWPFWCGLVWGLGTLSSPLVGMFADRFLNAEKVLALCNFAGAVFLGWAFCAKTPGSLFVAVLLTMLFYMPSWSLTATIAMANSTTEAFPQIRVFGSLGWVASAVFSLVGTACFGIANFDTTPYIFLSGAIGSAVGGVFALFLPATPPKAKGTPMSVADALGLKALVLLKRPDFLVFSALILLAMVPFQWYNAYNGLYLGEKKFQFITMTMNIGQVFELVFMLMIPFFLRKLGYKWAMVLGLGALAFRYGCFYFGAAGVDALDFGGILVHGLIFGLLVIGSQMYVDAAAPAELRGQAQGFMGLIMFGIGTCLSNWFFDRMLAANVVKETGAHVWTKPYAVAFFAAVVLAVLMAALFQPKKEEK